MRGEAASHNICVCDVHLDDEESDLYELSVAGADQLQITADDGGLHWICNSEHVGANPGDPTHWR